MVAYWKFVTDYVRKKTSMAMIETVTKDNLGRIRPEVLD